MNFFLGQIYKQNLYILGNLLKKVLTIQMKSYIETYMQS